MQQEFLTKRYQGILLRPYYQCYAECEPDSTVSSELQTKLERGIEKNDFPILTRNHFTEDQYHVIEVMAKTLD
ncbi:MAG: hypothetical protein ACR2IS_20105 [Nitrososphaeraceae archaeon]